MELVVSNLQHADAQKISYTVDEFCRAVGICRGTLYNPWKRGDGPKKMKVGGRTFISLHAADEYRRQCEAP
jgi:hypothetical protein